MKKELKSFFKKYCDRAFKSKEVAKKLGIKTEHEYQQLKATLYKLYQENFLIKSGKKYSLNLLPKSNKITGILSLTNEGYGFVIPDDKSLKDIFIPSRYTGTAFNGDKVEVLLFANKRGKNLEGQIIRVISRKRKEFIGVVKKAKSLHYIVPEEPDVHKDIFIDPNKTKGANVGDKVVVGNITWEDENSNPVGEILEIFKEEDILQIEAASIARDFGIPFAFSNNALEEANQIESAIDPKEINKRIDFRDKIVFTIDPEDAKDFDDALSIEKNDSGNFIVGIHIADVSYYIKPDSYLDKEALKRGNSVYLVGKAIPMLPEKLSNGICSLNPNEDRLTFSVIAELSPRGKLINYQISKTIINSKRRFTYDEVQQIIEKKKGEFVEQILQLDKLAKILRKKRMKSGSFDFNTSEVKFKLDQNGYPTEAYIKTMKDSNMLIEEFMLLANKIVAEEISKNLKLTNKPFIYRVHDLPDKEKIIEFARFVKSLGYQLNPLNIKKPTEFQKVLEQAKGKPEENLINELAIRSMAKAFYSTQNIGHYGLGFKYYTHFTSPIRRYSDLIVHRLLYNYLQTKPKNLYDLDELDEICEHISSTERVAMEAERFSIKLKQVELLSNQLGSEFEAIISGIVHFGIFVKITSILAEGLIRLRDLDDDFYIYDEKKYAIIGRRTKKTYRLGDKVNVKLVKVNTDRLELDFIIVE
ncbi:MAG: ribonuclease R [Ignavibacterium sp.]|nr:ribonuclease R [Ignavibacterium sp.]MCX7611681.1 ribonuclease R [Ignavibacterium sp.]MDW8375735.1 ribonuclease R [Ignavibacteriales bacterium]